MKTSPTMLFSRCDPDVSTAVQAVPTSRPPSGHGSGITGAGEVRRSALPARGGDDGAVQMLPGHGPVIGSVTVAIDGAVGGGDPVSGAGSTW